MLSAVQACVVGMFELQEFSAFKQHLRDFLVQTKSFASQDNADLFAEEVAQQREVKHFSLQVRTSHGSSRQLSTVAHLVLDWR